MKILSADWILPIAQPPIVRGAVVVDDRNVITAVDTIQTIHSKFPRIPITEFRNSIILPGLVNAHTHLELSMMRGALAGDQKFPDWAYGAITKRSAFTPEQIAASCREAVDELLRTGTVAVGDIANHSDTSWRYLVESGLYGIQFHEVTGFPAAMVESRFREFVDRLVPSNGSRISQSIGPHSPYSVSAELFKMIGGYCRDRGLRTTVHLAESGDEVEFLKSGTGGFKELLLKLDRWDPAWHAPGLSPVQYLDRLGFLDENTLVVHAVHVTDEDIALLRRQGASVCTCPRSNEKIDVGGQAPIEAMLHAGSNVCIGTDSLASNDDLNLWNEMAALRLIHPSIKASTILQMATLNGARALGLDHRIGSIEAGKDAAVVCVQAHDPVKDPAEFLLSGYERLKAVWRV